MKVGALTQTYCVSNPSSQRLAIYNARGLPDLVRSIRLICCHLTESKVRAYFGFLMRHLSSGRVVSADYSGVSVSLEEDKQLQINAEQGKCITAHWRAAGYL